jgi:hypothetical protein
MYQVRALIEDLQAASVIAQSMGATHTEKYAFTDTIYVPPDKGIKHGYLRIRQYDHGLVKLLEVSAQNDRNTPAFHTMRKHEFPSSREMHACMQEHYSLWSRQCSYKRTGDAYALGQNGIFLEDIAVIGPSVEVESPTRAEAERILSRFSPTRKIHERMPVFMARIMSQKSSANL